MRRLSEPDPSHVRRVAFLKLLKTGGTSFASCVLFPYCVRHGLKYLFPCKEPFWAVTKDNLAPVRDKDNKFHMLFRHFPDFPKERAWLDDALGRPIYMTLVRNPLARAVSQYNHNVLWLGYKKPFREFVEHGDHRANHQSNWLGYDGKPNSLASIVNMVGLNERFDESMILFRRALDLQLSDLLYVSQRITKQAAGRSPIFRAKDVDDDTASLLREIDHLDYQLYAEAEVLFAQQRRANDGLDAELELYREALNDWRHPLWRERGAFKIGYVQGDEWGEFTDDGQYRHLQKLRG